ncbi:MAG: hypothetical protein V1831_00385 [Candidatus Woesearchaeota archaeon]
MDNPVLKTSADDLYELVKLRKKISIEDIAKLLKIPDKTAQALVDFLVEEKVFGMEYKFTTPYVYLNKEGKRAGLEVAPVKKLVTKDDFFQKAKRWNMPYERVNSLWMKYIQENLNLIREDFYKKANARNIPQEKIEGLWKRYMDHLK